MPFRPVAGTKPVGGRSKFSPDQVFHRPATVKDKVRYIRISIGADVASRTGLQSGDKVAVEFDDETGSCRVRRCNDGKHIVRAPKGAPNKLGVSFTPSEDMMQFFANKTGAVAPEIPGPGVFQFAIN